MRSSSGSREEARFRAAFAHLCRADPILRSWIRSDYLDPRALRESALARRAPRWAVADHFFIEQRLEALARRHARLAFEEDDEGLNYHSTATRVDRLDEEVGLDLFRHPIWHRYAAFVLNTDLHDLGRTVVKYRRHPPYARGFWIHTDRDSGRSKSLAVLGYLNRGWRSSDGGLLQLWEGKPHRVGSGRPLRRWAAFEGTRLSFLERDRIIDIQAAAPRGLVKIEARLIAQIVPAWNRVVFLDFRSSPAYHSVTPSRRRARLGFLQWLY
ncbi:MAG: 2OG-Fe(II) oxygenase [Myxococcota bacterium]